MPTNRRKAGRGDVIWKCRRVTVSMTMMPIGSASTARAQTISSPMSNTDHVPSSTSAVVTVTSNAVRANSRIATLTAIASHRAKRRPIRRPQAARRSSSTGTNERRNIPGPWALRIASCFRQSSPRALAVAPHCEISVSRSTGSSSNRYEPKLNGVSSVRLTRATIGPIAVTATTAATRVRVSACELRRARRVDGSRVSRAPRNRPAIAAMRR